MPQLRRMGRDDDEAVSAEPKAVENPFIVAALRANQAARRDVDACFRLGISPRRFEGWEPKQTTRYRYDDEGRLRETVTTREPEFDAEDRQILIAAMDADAATCHRGHAIPQNLKLAAKDQPVGYRPPRYVGKTLICLQCEFEAEYG